MSEKKTENNSPELEDLALVQSVSKIIESILKEHGVIKVEQGGYYQMVERLERVITEQIIQDRKNYLKWETLES